MSPPQQLRQQTSNCSSLLIYRPRKDERLSWPSWLTYSGWLTHISGHQSSTSRAQDSESTSAKDQCSTAGPRNHRGCVDYGVEKNLINFESDRLRLSFRLERIYVNQLTRTHLLFAGNGTVPIRGVCVQFYGVPYVVLCCETMSCLSFSGLYDGAVLSTFCRGTFDICSSSLSLTFVRFANDNVVLMVSQKITAAVPF